MMSWTRLIRIMLIAYRYRLDDLVLSGISHPFAATLLRCLRFGKRPKMPRGMSCLLYTSDAADE